LVTTVDRGGVYVMTKKVALTLSKNHQVVLFVIAPLLANETISITKNFFEIRIRMWSPKIAARIPSSFVRWFFILLHMIRFFNYFLKFDILAADGIHGHGSFLSVICRLSNTLTGKRRWCIILTYGLFNLEKLEWCRSSRIPRIRLWFYNFLELISIRYSDIILTADKRTVGYICEKGGRSKVIYEPKCQAVDVAKFSFSSEVKKHYRKKLGIPESDIVLLFVGSFLFHNGPDIALEVYRKIAKEDKRVWLMYIGSWGDQKDIIKTEVLKEKLGKVIFLGWIPYDVIQNYMMIGDIGLLPRREPVCGIGNVTLEMMSLGIPIITTNVGTLSYVIVDGENGFITSENNVEKMVKSAKFLIDNPVEREEMRRRAYEVVVENFSFDAFSRKIDDIIRKLRRDDL